MFQLAGRVRVTVVRVDLETAKIDFTLAADLAAVPPSLGAKPAEGSATVRKVRRGPGVSGR